MERVAGSLASTVRERQVLKSQIDGELITIDRQLKEGAAVKPESDAILVGLNDLLRRNEWSLVGKDGESQVSSLVETFSELLALAKQVEAITWTETPVTLPRLKAFCRTARRAAEHARQDIPRLEAKLSEQRQTRSLVERARAALNVLQQLKPLIASGVALRVTEHDGLQEEVAILSTTLTDPPLQELAAFATVDLSIPELRARVTQERSIARRALTRASNQYEEFARLRERSVNLAQQLREVAARILDGSPTPDICPLCHTPFKPGELQAHIARDLDQSLEGQARTHLNQVRQHEAAFERASAAERGLTWLVQFCEQAELGPDCSVREAFLQVEATRTRLTDATARLEILDREIASLEERGFSVKRIEELTEELEQLDYHFDPHRDAIEATALAIQSEHTSLSTASQSVAAEAQALLQSLQKTLNVASTDAPGFRAALVELDRRLATTELIHDRLTDMLRLYSWSLLLPVSES
jgi:hypothetical protein